MGFKLGYKYNVHNARKMMLVHSANDMAVVLAKVPSINSPMR